MYLVFSFAYVTSSLLIIISLPLINFSAVKTPAHQSRTMMVFHRRSRRKCVTTSESLLYPRQPGRNEFSAMFASKHSVIKGHSKYISLPYISGKAYYRKCAQTTFPEKKSKIKKRFCLIFVTFSIFFQGNA